MWKNNVQIPVRSGGVSIPEVLGYCDPQSKTIKPAWGARRYKGVTIYTTEGGR